MKNTSMVAKLERLLHTENDNISIVVVVVTHSPEVIRSTPASRPNKAGLKCPSVRPQKLSSILMKFGM